MTKITKVCEYCGKERTLYPSDYHSKVFFTCSKECQYLMQSKLGKEKWANLTPEQRKQWTDNINESHHCDGQGFIDYWAEHNEKMLAHTVKAIQNHKGGISVTERIDMKISQSPCVLLKAHAIIMKDDPERLTTDFLQHLIGRKCRTNDTN